MQHFPFILFSQALRTVFFKIYLWGFMWIIVRSMVFSSSSFLSLKDHQGQHKKDYNHLFLYDDQNSSVFTADYFQTLLSQPLKNNQPIKALTLGLRCLWSLKKLKLTQFPFFQQNKWSLKQYTAEQVLSQDRSSWHDRAHRPVFKSSSLCWFYYCSFKNNNWGNKMKAVEVNEQGITRQNFQDR